LALRHILVHVDESDLCASRLDLAIGLAKKFQARLTGFFGENDPRVMTVALLDVERDLAPRVAKAEASFRKLVEGAGLQAEWSAATTVSDVALVRETVFAAQACDLAILGQHDPSRFDIRVPADLAEQVVLHSGRPVLIVPHSGRFSSIGRRVMIAWNAGREAARALNDAIPLLQAAEHVMLVAINVEQRGKVRPGEPFSHVLRHLEAHGVRVEMDRMIVEDIGAMDMLLGRLTDEAIDLLVMGAHGHYGFPYMHRGGSTRHILRQMTVPVLMSH
jgi:nucleotide-binding universal stress UspA family protein